MNIVKYKHTSVQQQPNAQTATVLGEEQTPQWSSKAAKKKITRVYFETDLYSITENVFNHNDCTSQFEVAYDKMLRDNDKLDSFMLSEYKIKHKMNMTPEAHQQKKNMPSS